MEERCFRMCYREVHIYIYFVISLLLLNLLTAVSCCRALSLPHNDVTKPIVDLERVRVSSDPSRYNSLHTDTDLLFWPHLYRVVGPVVISLPLQTREPVLLGRDWLCCLLDTGVSPELCRDDSLLAGLWQDNCYATLSTKGGGRSIGKLFCFNFLMKCF